MNVKRTPHAEELLEAVRTQRHEPVERILEFALEALVRNEHVEPVAPAPNAAQRLAVADMIEFVKRNRVHLGEGRSVKDLIHEGHRI